MGLLPCPFPCSHHPNKDPNSHSNSNINTFHSDSSTSFSLSSLPSLPSVPSLTPSSLPDLIPSSTIIHHHRLATLQGHSYIFSLAFYGKFLLSASSNGGIRAWNRDPSNYNNPPPQDVNPTSTNCHMVATSTGAVKSLAVLGDKLFSAHQDRKIRVWKIDYTHTVEATQGYASSKRINLHPKLTCIATLPTANDRLLRFFSPKNYVQVRRHKKCTWVHHVDTVSALAISNDCFFLYSASWDRTFKVWTTSDFRCLESVARAHDDAINAIVVSKDGVVYTGSADKRIKAWRKLPGEKKHSLVGVMEKHKSAVNALAVSADGSTLYSGACDRPILVWGKEIANSENSDGELVVVGALRGHCKAVLCLVVVEDLVCSGSADNTVRIWRQGLDKSYSCLAVLEGHKRPIKGLIASVDSGSTRCDHSDASSNNYLVYSGSLDCDIKVWHIKVPLITS